MGQPPRYAPGRNDDDDRDDGGFLFWSRPVIRFGNEEDNRLFGGNGNDILVGFAGDDLIKGGNGNDYLNGGDGDDSLFGGNGHDILVTGAGNDLADGGNGNDLLVGGRGNNLLAGGNGMDVVFAGPGNTIALGGNGADKLFGGTGQSALFGGRGPDVLIGGAGTDLVVGGQGNDFLSTGTGLGAHVGGEGRDIFRIGDEILRNQAVDRILAVDFDPNEDILSLGRGILAGLGDATVEDITITRQALLDTFEDTGLLDPALPPLLDQLSDGDAVERDLITLLEDLPDTTDAVRVTLATGDEIVALGLSAADLTDLLG